MSFIRNMDPTQLSMFLLSKNLVEKGQADEIVEQDVDGEILLGMTAADLKCHVGFSFGKATNLVRWLQTNSTLPTLKPVVALIKSVGEVRDAEYISDQGFGSAGMQQQTPEQVSIVMRKKIATKPSPRGRKGKLLSELPPDLVRGISDLYVRIFHKKPSDEYPNMWGRGYLEFYHPKAHLVHNKNVEKMRLLFSDVYNPVVAKAWLVNFKGNKDTYQATLDFIEGCIPQLEALVLTIRGVSMSVRWEAKDIMKGWFSEHKKHSIRLQRIEQIEQIEAEKKAFVRSIPVSPANALELECHGDQNKDFLTKDVCAEVDMNDTEPAHKLNPERWPGSDLHSRAFMDITNSDNSGDKYVNEDSLKSSKTFGNFKVSTLEASKHADDSVHAHRVHQSDIEMTCSPEHKRYKKTPLVVGALVPEVLFQNHGPESKPIKSEGYGQPVESGETELVSDDEEHPECSSGTKLSAMSGLKRNTIGSSISDTSEDFHSPILSDNSTETIDSAKLKHPKKSLHELYPLKLVHDTPAFEFPRVTRSKLPTTSSTCIRKGFSEGENKMANLKAMTNSNNIKENASLVSVVTISKGKSVKAVSSTQQQAWRFEHLDEDSKLTIAFRAMKLRSKKEVKPQLMSFIVTQNQRIELYNAQSSASFKLAVPFPGCKQLGIPAALDLLVKWALEFKVDIVNPPKLVNGKLQLFSNHTQDK